MRALVCFLGMETETGNPWQVDSIEAFYCIKCPECEFDTKEEYTFQAHAVENHPLSFAFFGKSEEESYNQEDYYDQNNDLSLEPEPLEPKVEYFENEEQELKYKEDATENSLNISDPGGITKFTLSLCDVLFFLFGYVFSNDVL